MENASKALLFAAGILITIVILASLILGLNELSEYKQKKHDMNVATQTAEFNKVYVGYNRDNVRGNDLISLMNRVKDYNEREAEETSKLYTPITLKIKLGDTSQYTYTADEVTKGIKNVLPLPKDGSGSEIIISSSKDTDQISDIESQLISGEDYNSLNLTKDKLTKLATGISNIFIDESDKSSAGEVAVKRRNQLIKDILGIDESELSNAKLKDIKEVTYQYYQLTQFKRAYFKCIEFEYDEGSGRVKKMTYEFTGKFG